MQLSPVAVIVRLKIRAGQEDAFQRELAEILKQVRQEPACISIAGHQHTDDPTSFLLVEVWESREAFSEFEGGREYLREYMERVTPLWSAPRDMSFWQTVA
jgi:quinol monooxygenase YgiN